MWRTRTFCVNPQRESLELAESQNEKEINALKMTRVESIRKTAILESRFEGMQVGGATINFPSVATQNRALYKRIAVVLWWLKATYSTYCHNRNTNLIAKSRSIIMLCCEKWNIKSKKADEFELAGILMLKNVKTSFETLINI